MRTIPRRLITLQSSQRRLTDARTCIAGPPIASVNTHGPPIPPKPVRDDESAVRRSYLSIPIRDTAARQIIRRQFNLYPVTLSDADIVHPHLPRNMGQHFDTIVECHFEHGIWQWLDDRALDL